MAVHMRTSEMVTATDGTYTQGVACGSRSPKRKATNYGSLFVGCRGCRRSKLYKQRYNFEKQTGRIQGKPPL